jgi:hypothetical protein
LEEFRDSNSVQFDLNNLSGNRAILNVLYPIIQQLFIYNSQPLVVAQAFALPLELVEKVMQNVLAISELKTSKGRPRFSHPYILRRSHALEQSLSGLMSRLAKIEIKDEQVTYGLKLYLDRARKNHTYRVRLLGALEVEGYFTMLKSMKLANTKIGLRVFPSTYHKKSDGDLKRYWTKVFQAVSKGRVQPLIQIKSPITCANEFGNVELEPIKNLSKDQHELLEHYQYAIYLLAIFFR